MDTLHTLIKEVSQIVARDKQEQEDRWKRGECFNVFNILRLDTNETRTHSAFIAELLDPNGAHGLGDAFLKAFLETLAWEEFELDTQSAKVDMEFPIGFKNEDCSEGGRLDILITAKDKAILIENKIYAGDQENQLIRYFNYGRSQYADKFRLIYLTLDGHDASECSAKNTNQNLSPKQGYYPISYDGVILDWLHKCIRLSVFHPLVRETLRQYQALIEQLTGKNMNENNNKELISTLTSSGNIEATLAILESQHEIGKEIRRRFLEELRNWVENEKGWCLYIWGDAIGLESWSEIVINKDKNCQWAIYFDKETTRDSYRYSISYFGDNESLKITLPQNYFKHKPKEGYPSGYTDFIPYGNWTAIDTLRDMTNGKVLKAMQEIIEPIMQDIESGIISLK